MQIRRRPNPSRQIQDVRLQVAAPDMFPNNILEEIVWHKELEVENWRDSVPLKDLRKKLQDCPPSRNFLEALRAGKTQPALIAEVKKASPSKGVIREDFDPVVIAKSYAAGGATCLSVLTDIKFFQGSFENLTNIQAEVDLPLLCKDFVLYPYQIFLARLRGADAILLIAAILTDQDLQYFLKICKSVGVTPLIEVHTLEELERVLQLDGVELVGINNRNLEDFSVSLETTTALLAKHGETLRDRNILVVSESGLYTADDLQTVGTAGARAVLIGESLVKQPDPGAGIPTLYPEQL
ncbi:MAG: indole-3-glycerol phosphate synthase TrpC [Cyanobacteria bacterium P01_H01_bin.15]